MTPEPLGTCRTCGGITMPYFDFCEPCVMAVRRQVEAKEQPATRAPSELESLRAEAEKLTIALEVIGKNYRGVQQSRNDHALNFRKANVKLAEANTELTRLRADLAKALAELETLKASRSITEQDK